MFSNALSVRSIHDRLRSDEIELLAQRIGSPIPIGFDAADEFFRDADEYALDEFLERLAPAHQRCEFFVPVRFAEPVAWGATFVGSLSMLREDLERVGAEQWRRATREALETRRIVEFVRL